MKPVLLHYYLTNRCNSKCVFCTIWQEMPKVDADPEDVIRNLYQAKKAGCSFVDFTGGEPLLHDHLPFFLKEAKKLNYLTSVTTNCILFKKRVNEIQGLIDLLHFSIDSESPQEHNKIRGVDCYSSVIESIDLAKQYNLSPDLLFTYTNENINSISGIYGIAQANKLILILDPVFDPWAPDKVTNYTHMKAMKYGKMKGIYLNKAHLALRSEGGNHIRNPLCRAVDTTIVIQPDNQLALPCFHHRCISIPIGINLGEVLLSENYKNAKKMQGRYLFCENCHINCYFDPTYTFLRNKMAYLSFMAKFRYFWTKYILFGNRFPKIKFF